MRVLVVHNRYQHPGGEDVVVEAETLELRRHGHIVIPFERHNDELKQLSPWPLVKRGVDAIWAQNSYRAIRGLLESEKPDVAHFHNTFHLISPSAYYACAAAGIPVIQTLHNYRLLCPAATLMRQGKPCEECLNRPFGWPGVVHRCYRSSSVQTAVVAATVATHRALGTWRNKVTTYIALTEYARSKFISGGLPPERITVKANFLSSDPGAKNGPGEFALFVGRLSAEKGLHTLFAAWKQVRCDIPLRVIGEGPLRPDLERQVRTPGLHNVRILGARSREFVLEQMKRARFLVIPSLWFEGFPMAVAEAFASGLPVLASRLGSLEELISPEVTGLDVAPGDSEALARGAERLWNRPDWCEELGRRARCEYLEKYSAERGYRRLMQIYESACGARIAA